MDLSTRPAPYEALKISANTQATERVATGDDHPEVGDQVGSFLVTIQLTIRDERCDRLSVARIVMASKVTFP